VAVKVKHFSLLWLKMKTPTGLMGGLLGGILAASYPRRVYTLIALLMVLTLLYGIVRLIVATIEDHME